jgi:phosphatidylglycerol:prolipoprotein diacylglycerol transferase
MLDLLAPACMLGQAIGRWGNFMNREAFGRETGIFCRMGLMTITGETVYVHPTFLYESVWNLIGFLFLDRMIRRGKRQFDGECLCLYLLWYGAGRAWIEGLRTDSLTLGGTGIRVSQVLSLVVAAVSAGILLWRRRRQN